MFNLHCGKIICLTFNLKNWFQQKLIWPLKGNLPSQSVKHLTTGARQAAEGSSWAGRRRASPARSAPVHCCCKGRGRAVAQLLISEEKPVIQIFMSILLIFKHWPTKDSSFLTQHISKGTLLAFWKRKFSRQTVLSSTWYLVSLNHASGLKSYDNQNMSPHIFEHLLLAVPHLLRRTKLNSMLVGGSRPSIYKQ